ncbi:outer membrane protein assembly factor BamB family protein [Halorussus salinisoli]|uniref:outer membrane protein assembly factor BamB family protein n=1 Tax=Halorussus salinisoli TaxID=2558242 RepID=UPI0010C20E0B|nr:PQQ-binding-like beta-propeller repeat protein [Halorussus salinisoli]
MVPSRSRRAFLRAVTVGSLGLAGCTGERRPVGSTTTPPPSTTATTDGETTAGTTGPDERVTETPPGAPALPASGEWPTYRFDARNTGYNPDGDGLRDGEQYWRLRAGGPASVSDDALFNVSGYERDEGALTRRDPGTLSVRSATGLVGYGINSPPTVADGRVFVTTFVEAFCLAADRDEVLWRGPEMDGIHGAPTVSDDTVFVNSGGYQSVPAQLRAFDAASGDQRWRYDTESESKSAPAVADGRVFVVARDGLHAIDAATGAGLFVVGDAGDEWSAPVVADGTVYVVAYRDEDDELFAIDAADGTVHWRFQPSGLDGEPPVVADGTVYVGTDRGVVALDSSDGTRTTTLGNQGTPVARVGDVIYATDRGTLFALDAEGDGEGVLWSHRTEQVQIEDTIGRNIYGVTPVDGAVYVSARDAFHGFGPVLS